ncbi:class I SAM-dependent methyltransferase [Kitasatospora sp. NPDC092039]|uniref:class I SAM-dependent methyltransferase n=1 Tax=Kitasatospora sp. NPDC092039 TaxID=3364086 RepID=UPI0037FAE64B
MLTSAVTGAQTFATAYLEQLADKVIPEEHAVLTAEDARATYFRDADALEVKQSIHDRFRTNPKALHDHLLEALALRGTEELLDLGCGNAFVLERLRPHLAAGHLTGLDISPAMLAAARHRLAGVATPCEWIEGTADRLDALADDTFDRVMCVYTAHYVADLGRCFAEVRRVLRPGGRFLLTTDRPDSMVEMYDVHLHALRTLDGPDHLAKASSKARISLTNGRRHLVGHFEQIRLLEWQDQLQFADVAPFLAFYRASYHCSASAGPDPASPALLAALEEHVAAAVADAIDARGYFAVTKLSGTFICS